MASKSQSEDKGVPPHSAWLARQEEISGFLRDSSNHGVTAAYIQSPHASGKSTTPLKYIHTLADKMTSPPKVVYLLPTGAEVNMLSRYFDQDFWPAAFAAKSLELESFENFLSKFQPEEASQRCFFLLLDAEINPSLHGEIALALVLQWARRFRTGSTGHAIMLLSPFYSPSLFQALERSIAAQPSLIQVPDINPEVNLRVFQGLWTDKARHLVLASAESEKPMENRVIMSATNVWSLEHSEKWKYVPFARVNVLVDTFMDSSVHVYDPRGIDFSLAVPQLTAFLSTGATEVDIFDPSISQIVKRQRVCNQLEMRCQMSWTLKCQSPSEAVFWSPVDEPRLGTRPTGIDSGGEAYNGDIYFTVLWRIHLYKGKMPQDTPARLPPDRLAVREVCRRLEALGLIERCGDAYESTDRGFLALQLRYSMGLELDIHVVRFLSVLADDDDKLTRNVKRIMIRIGALFMHEISKAYGRTGPEDPIPTIDQLKAVCAGPGVARLANGAAWCGLGIYQYLIHTGRVRGSGAAFERDSVHINPASAKVVEEQVNKLESFFSIPATFHEVRDTDINAVEMDLVETQLASSWLHRMVFIKAGTELGFDLVSGALFSIDPEETLDIRGALDAAGGEGIFATYSELRKKGTTARREVRSLSVISRDILHPIAARFPAGFPESIMTSYPT